MASAYADSRSRTARVSPAGPPAGTAGASSIAAASPRATSLRVALWLCSSSR